MKMDGDEAKRDAEQTIESVTAFLGARATERSATHVYRSVPLSYMANTPRYSDILREKARLAQAEDAPPPSQD